MMHLLPRRDADRFYGRGLDLAEDTGVWTFAITLDNDVTVVAQGRADRRRGHYGIQRSGSTRALRPVAGTLTARTDAAAGSYCCCSVGRIKISLTATCRGRVTTYAIASAMS